MTLPTYQGHQLLVKFYKQARNVLWMTDVTEEQCLQAQITELNSVCDCRLRTYDQYLPTQLLQTY